MYVCLSKVARVLLIVSTLNVVCISSNECGSVVDLYDDRSCKVFWRCTSERLLQSVNKTVNRQDFEKLKIEEIGHTPMWLRINSDKLFCVTHPGFQIKSYRIKVYRAAHYINRLNRLLRQGKLRVADGTEWWTHHSDWVKVPQGRISPPVFSVSGASHYSDIAGIPFMSFSDKISSSENDAFLRLKKRHKFHFSWDHRKGSVFFRGALSDCAFAADKHAGDVTYCARAKIIHYSKKSQNPLLSDVSTTSTFEEVGLSISCNSCTSRQRKGESFVNELMTHKYVLDFPGAGNWSRRMSLLLRSGALILKSESPGYQFYEVNLKPGIHYIPFDPEIGRTGAGNLLARLEWAQSNDETAKQIARTSQSFGRSCLTESSIDEFLSILLTQYSKRLKEDPIDYPLVDLSDCFSNSKDYYKLSKLCEESIQKCWAVGRS